MNITQVVAGLENTLKAVQNLAPLASQFGGGQVAGMVSAAASIANNVLERVKEGEIVATERDVTIIRDISGHLAVVNNQLASAIAKS